MDADLDTLATALYARIDDTLKQRPGLGAVAPESRDRTEALRCRIVDIGRDASVARSRQRDRLASLRQPASVASVPLPNCLVRPVFGESTFELGGGVSLVSNEGLSLATGE